MSENENRKITKLVGTAIPVRGNDIDTDRIIPARYLKEATFSRMGEYPFFDERFDTEGKSKPHPFNDPKFKGASILFVNKNFGCGSSREHAPQALSRFGIRAIVGESYGTIFTGNCVMLGVPTLTIATGEIEKLMTTVESVPMTDIKLDLESKTLSCGEWKLSLDLPESHRVALITGAWDSTFMLRANLETIRTSAAKLPYMNNFKS